MASEEPACPVCGNTEWEGTKPVKLRFTDPRYMRGGGIDVTAYVCTRCDFIRLHRTGNGSHFAKPS